MTAIVPSELADELKTEGPDFARITLMVHSDLEGVGLTAAVSGALADAGIACNMVAAFITTTYLRRLREVKMLLASYTH